jgi:hypothetical protein
MLNRAREFGPVVKVVQLVREMIQGVSETLCMRVTPCSFGESFIEPFGV